VFVCLCVVQLGEYGLYSTVTVIYIRLKVGTTVEIGLNQTYNGVRVGELHCLAYLLMRVV
jgi:hypothetical protein